MPHRRMFKRGSFGGHLDELVKHFPHDKAHGPAEIAQPKPEIKDRDIHDHLFDGA